MGNANNVIVGGGVGGQVLFGPTGTTLPTTAGASLNAAFNDLGHISEDGVTESKSEDTSDIKAWDGSIVRKIRTSDEFDLKFAMLETNPNTLAVYYGASNFDDTLNRVEVKAGSSTRGAWIVDEVDGNSVKRIVVPDGEVSTHEDVVNKNDEAVVYGVTVTCYPDTNDVKAYMYFDVPAVS